MTHPPLPVLPADRPKGWHGRLYAWALSIAATPHEYGQHDCALYVAGGLDAMYGTDIAGRFRGRYTTYRGGLRALRREGFRDHLDLLSHFARPVDPALAQIGDIAVVDTPDHPAIGFVMGGDLQMLTLDGLISTPTLIETTGGIMRAAREVWRT